MTKKEPRGRGTASAGLFGVFDEVFNPAAARALQELEQQHEMVIAVPSPGEMLLKSAELEIESEDADPGQ